MKRLACVLSVAGLLVACSGSPSCPTGHTYDDTCRVITDAMREKCPNTPTFGCNTYSFAKCRNTAGVCSGDVSACLTKIRTSQACEFAIGQVYACTWSCAD